LAVGGCSDFQATHVCADCAFIASLAFAALATGESCDRSVPTLVTRQQNAGAKCPASLDGNLSGAGYVGVYYDARLYVN
jgi:hypothetical protein